MGQIKATIEKDDLEKYGGVGIALMNTRNGVESGGDRFQVYTTIEVIWDDTAGFTGISWEPFSDTMTQADINAMLSDAQVTAWRAAYVYNSLISISNPDANRMGSAGCFREIQEVE